MNIPLVTIAIPIYNAEKYLRYAIQSCINQTFLDWELLLMCDGSIDDSTLIAQKMSLCDSRIKVYDDGENRGLIYRLNQSIWLAQGEYYARMDADDIMYLNRIETQVCFLEEHPDVDVVGSSVMAIDDKNNIVSSAFFSGNVENFVHPTVMGRTQWFRKYPYADWALRAEDTELWYRTSATSKFYAIEKPLLFYREFGVPTLKKYFLSGMTLLKIFFRFPHYGKGILWCVRNVLLTIIKVVVYSVFYVFGRLDYLVGKRKMHKPVPVEIRLQISDLRESIKEIDTRF